MFVFKKYGSVIIKNTLIFEKIDNLDKLSFINDNILKKIELFNTIGYKCVNCLIDVKYFAIQEIVSDNSDCITINFYGVNDNNMIFFTKDHIMPKSLGGQDNVINYQSMCWKCNSKKSNTYSAI